MGIVTRVILHQYIIRWLAWWQAPGGGDPLETLWIEIKAELDGAQDAIDDFVDDSKQKLEGLGDTGEQSGNRMGQGVKQGSALAQVAFGFMFSAGSKALDVVLKLATALPNFLQNSARQAIAANKQFETFTSQFTTLLGSEGLANERLEELARFGVETPFELPEIVEASRQLEVFGGATIATGENLRLIGDLAAGVNQPIQGVAFWIGRMYDALQNGQPFGEAAMRLQEMGILSGDVRREIEDMAKSGEDGTVVFERFAERVGSKFSGNMQRLSETLGGVQSNLADFQGNLLRVSGRELFEEFRQANIDFLATLDANEAQITAIGQNVGGIMADILSIGRELSEGFDLKALLTQLENFTKGLRDTVKNTRPLLLEIKRLGATFVNFAVDVATAGEQLKEEEERAGILAQMMETLSQIVAFSTAGWAGLLATLKPVFVILRDLSEAMMAIKQLRFNDAVTAANKALEGFKTGLVDVEAGNKAFKESLRDSLIDMGRLEDGTKDLDDALDDLGDDPVKEEDLIEEPDAIGDQLQSLTNQMLDAVEQRDNALAAAQERHNERMASIVQRGNARRLSIEETFNQSVEQLHAENARRREEIISSTQEALAKLRQSTDKQLNDRRKDFQEQERRETEDHFRELRKIEDDYLFNLQDAVRARDARAIIDLQRDFERTTTRKQEDFDIGQGRDRQDFSQELAEIRQNERDRRDELLKAQADQLADLQVHEAQRLAELKAKRDEDLENLRIQTAQQLQAERENFAEREASLNEALQKRLATMAKSLADQNEVTAEGARGILETFNDYFGIGGNIDKIMDDFTKRRNQRMEIEVKLKETRPRTSGLGATGGGFDPRVGQQAAQAAATSGGITSETGQVRLPSGVLPFAGGGSMLATKPTLALFGENEPELAVFTPASQMPASGGMGRKVQVEFSGSAPPGIGTSQRDQIAGVVLSALEESGVLSRRGA